MTRQGGSREIQGRKPKPIEAMNEVAQSLLTPSHLLALFEEAAKPGGDPHTALCAARSVLNLAYIGEEREMPAYHEDPMSRYAPSECARLVCRPWRRLRDSIEGRIAVLEREVEAAENDWFPEVGDEAVVF